MARALDRGDPDDLARSNVEGCPSDAQGAASVGDRYVARGYHRLPCDLGSRARWHEVVALAKHRLDQSILIDLHTRPCQRSPAATQHRNVVRNSQSFPKLVRDQHDRATRVGQLTDPAQEIIGFARCQHSRGLVEDQRAVRRVTAPSGARDAAVR